jgi:hypothetical protein
VSIRLDWEIEAEQAHQAQTAGEDPDSKRQRRIARLRLLGFIGLVLVVLGTIAALVVWRLRSVDQEIEQLLRDTVDAEVAALRLGDANAFLAAQCSATDEWLLAQQEVFSAYQLLMLEHDVQLTGRILGVTIENTRARVQVEEILDGAPYTRTWFYWRYQDDRCEGWRHVPPDYTFWGELRTYVGDGVSVRYRAVDNPMAAAAGLHIEEWLRTGCAALTCPDDMPDVMIEIVPDDALMLGWSVNDPWLLQMPSPYVTRARSDIPFELGAQIEVSNLLAERLVGQASNSIQPNYPADAYYLRQAVISWLVGRFAQIDTHSFLIMSLTQNYGDESVGRLMQAIQPDSDVHLLSEIIGVSSLEQANLDWRDFLTWRLTVEDELIARRDESGFLALYDTRDEAVRTRAYERFNAQPAGERKVVVSLSPLETGGDGSPQLRATVHIGEGETLRQEETLFRLVDGVWKRAN